MPRLPAWNPYDDWRPVKVDWVKVDISKEDMKRFTKRSDLLGLRQTFLFLSIVGCTAAVSLYAFSTDNLPLLVLGLYLHGMVYGHFGDGIHELTHHTVFESKVLTRVFITLFGLLYWPYNPYLYRASHVHFHHRYTLHQHSDGEDVPNYVEFNGKTLFLLLFKVLHVKSLIQSLARLFTLKPVSKGWRMRGYALDPWERFVIEKAPEQEKQDIYRFSVLSLAVHLVYAAVCILSGNGFLIVLVTLAPFYGPGIHGFFCGIHQHANCEANHPDFRKSCGDAILDPISSILDWHMEYHIEHHMFASIPCYRLKAFGKYVADQMPPKEHAIPRVLRLARESPRRFGSREQWREDYGRFKGF